MRIVCISGSPRKNKNSEKIVEEAVRFFSGEHYTTEKILLSGVSVNPCNHCDYCKTKAACNQDDETNRVNEMLSAADAILVVSPVYFGSITGQLKSLFDKTLPLRRDGMRLKGKIGGAITVGNSRNGGQELALKDIHAWMLIHGMAVVGDNSHFGGTVQAAFEDDEYGAVTARGTLEAMRAILSRLVR